MKMISFCGIDCNKCDAFIATKNNDQALREKTAEKWAKEFNHPGLKAEDINCEGCLSESNIIFSHCKICEIRKCGKGKNLKNCAHCTDYACDKLQDFFKESPACKATLDEIKRGL